MDPERPGLEDSVDLEWFDPRPSGDFWKMRLSREKAIVFDVGSCFFVTVYKWVNSETGQVIHFDGHSHGVINRNNKELFTFSFLDGFPRDFLKVAGSFGAYLSTALDGWLEGTESASGRDPVLHDRVLEYTLKDRKESSSRRLQKLFLDSFFDWISLQFQHPDFDPAASFTCHCHDSVDGPLKVFFLYDNACNVVKYALNRYPQSLWEKQWLVDKLHWANHTRCSPLSDSGAWPFMCPVNTQIAEQKNRVTKCLQRVSCYLSWGRYLQLHHFLFDWVNQHQSLANRAIRLPTDIEARTLVGDGVFVSVRQSEYTAERPYILSQTSMCSVPTASRIMLPQPIHRQTLTLLASRHYAMQALKGDHVEPVQQFFRCLRPAPLKL